MSEREPTVALRHMLDAARRAIEIARPLTRERFRSEAVEVLALTRLVEILGEAARRLPVAFREAHPAIPWREITGTRDRLIHGYDQVDLDILWTIVRQQLPLLASQLEAILKTP